MRYFTAFFSRYLTLSKFTQKSLISVLGSVLLIQSIKDTALDLGCVGKNEHEHYWQLLEETEVFTFCSREPRV